MQDLRIKQALQQAAAANDPFDRMVILSHAGPRDGPIYGYDHDETQVSPHLNQHLWGPFTTALHAGTSEDALIYAGGCHTGGFDTGERDRTSRGPRPDESSWVEKASRASGRTVIGPAGLTSWWKTHDAILAMEGDRGAPQETRWAPPTRAVVVADRESKADAFEDVPHHRVARSGGPRRDDHDQRRGLCPHAWAGAPPGTCRLRLQDQIRLHLERAPRLDGRRGRGVRSARPGLHAAGSANRWQVGDDPLRGPLRDRPEPPSGRRQPLG